MNVCSLLIMIVRSLVNDIVGLFFGRVFLGLCGRWNLGLNTLLFIFVRVSLNVRLVVIISNSLNGDRFMLFSL